MPARTAFALVVVGLAAVLVAYGWAGAGPAGDANIGAGMLGIAGVGTLVPGLLALGAAAVKALRHR